MASSIETFFAAVKAAYEAELPVEQQGIIGWYYGAEYVSANRSWPRIVCVRPSQSYAPLTRAGTSVPSGAASETRDRYNRRSTLEWHAWFADDEATEAAVENLVVVQRTVAASGSSAVYVPVSATWPIQEQRTIADGAAYSVLTVEIAHRISDAFIALPEVVVSTQRHVGTFGADDEVVC